MMNSKWYLVCDIDTMKAVDLIQIPQTWGNATGLENQSDADLEDFYTWSPHPTISFVSVTRAIEMGIDQDSINLVVDFNKPAVLNWLRSMRDPLLVASDALTVTDRWNTLDVVDQNYVTIYRNKLRDLTTQPDLFNIVWPPIPKALESIRKIDISHIERPDPNFINILSTPTPEPDIAERQTNQWLRIKAERDKRTAGGVKLTVDSADYWFWTDDKSRGQYSLLEGFANRHALPDSYVLNNWKTMAGVFVPFTVALLHQVIDAGVQNESLVFNKAEEHRAAMLAAEDPDSYDYSTGWPPTYTGS